jgi:hypothetical protein
MKYETFFCESNDMKELRRFDPVGAAVVTNAMSVPPSASLSMPSEHVPTVVADDDDVADDDLEPSTVTGIHDTEQYVHEPPITESQILPFADPSSHCSPPSIVPLPHTGSFATIEEELHPV